MLRVITANVNGIRAAFKKGFLEFIRDFNPDIVCMQETKAMEMDLNDEIKKPLSTYHSFWHSARKKGYSGVGIYSKSMPDNIIVGMNYEFFDNEGRYLRLDFGDTSIISIYFPSGTSSEDRQSLKYDFLDFFSEKLLELKKESRNFILCGDWNIAHRPIDLKNWKANQKSSGFLPEERAWIDKVFNSNWIDSWRYLYENDPGYTWWSYRGQAYNNDVGWRIDYQIINPELKNKLISASVYKDIRFSDHAPLIVDYDLVI